MRLTIAGKKRGEKWEGALLEENNFKSVLLGEDLTTIVLGGLAEILVRNFPDGQNIVMDIFVETDQERLARGVKRG